jgi:peroxiredoxin
MRNRIFLVFGLLTAVSLCIASQGCTDGAKTEKDQDLPKSASGKKTSAEGKKKTPEVPDGTGDTQEPQDKQPGAAQVVMEPEVPKGDGLLTPDPLDPETPPEVPKVEMTQQHAQTCLVNVGDKLPNAQLPGLTGQSYELSKLFGEKFTVVVFFRDSDDASLTELADLEYGVGPLTTRERGVKVIGVCESGAPASIDATCKKAGVTFPILLDTEGVYFKRLATGKMPRTYLLDNTGTILWFDIDYTRDTRHDLREALRALVKK